MYFRGCPTILYHHTRLNGIEAHDLLRVRIHIVIQRHGFGNGHALVDLAVLQAPRLSAIGAPADTDASAAIVLVHAHFKATVGPLQLPLALALSLDKLTFKSLSVGVIVTSQAVEHTLMPGTNVQVAVAEIKAPFSSALSTTVLPRVAVAVVPATRAHAVLLVALPLAHVLAAVGKLERPVSVAIAIEKVARVHVAILPGHGALPVAFSIHVETALVDGLTLTAVVVACGRLVKLLLSNKRGLFHKGMGRIFVVFAAGANDRGLAVFLVVGTDQTLSSFDAILNGERLLLDGHLRLGIFALLQRFEGKALLQKAAGGYYTRGGGGGTR